MRALVVLALAACGRNKEPPPAESGSAGSAAPPPISREALLEGKLPDGYAATELVTTQCRICHAVEYLTQQRLTEAGWKKTIDKMRKFGAALDDTQAATLASYAAYFWNPDLPGRTWKAGPPPPGALPLE